MSLEATSSFLSPARTRSEMFPTNSLIEDMLRSEGGSIIRVRYIIDKPSSILDIQEYANI
jgi:hypothetical protein